MSVQSDKKRLLQTEVLERLERSAHPGELVTVYLNVVENSLSHGIYSVMIPSERADQALSCASWDLWDGFPDFTTHDEKGEERIEYRRFGNDKGFEPLVIERDFHGIRDDYAEISEEFRLFHNLYHHRKEKEEFLKINRRGDEHTVAVIEPSQLKIQLNEIRKFLAIKQTLRANIW